MRSLSRINALSIFALGLIGICFAVLFYEFLISRQNWQELPRVFACLIAPVPLALFFGFCTANRQNNEDTQPDPRVMTLILLVGIIVTIGFGEISRLFSDSNLASGITPLLAESTVFTASILNLVGSRNDLVAAALSGISIGLTTFVIFFN
jgi:hypothetical protein